MEMHLKRIYEPAHDVDGYRVLVDRLWPRGIRKEAARLDLWAKDVAPSTSLRKWFHQTKNSWPEFELRYLEELKKNPAVMPLLEELQRYPAVTLLYAVHDEKLNHAVVLQRFLESLMHN